MFLRSAIPFMGGALAALELATRPLHVRKSQSVGKTEALSDVVGYADVDTRMQHQRPRELPTVSPKLGR
ncbi:hypothetical protein [Methylobacterium sp. A54F]